MMINIVAIYYRAVTAISECVELGYQIKKKGKI